MTTNTKGGYAWCVRPAAWLLAAGMMLAACGGGGQQADADQQALDDDTPKKGTIRISVDESFKPVIDSQIKVYEASNPEAHIIAEYKSEAECLKDLENDSTRMVIVTRGLSDAERDAFKQKLGFAPSWGVLAWDAVAVVTNKQAKDSVFSMAELRAMLDGSAQSRYKIVMDGKTATSTVRFAIDTLLKGKPLAGRVEAASSSPEVVEFVARNTDAIGMLGVSWIGNQDDPEQLSFAGKVRVASLKCETCDTVAYVKPYQANIAMGRYPLLRSLNYILKENYTGLGRGFVNFLMYERGQLIFKRAYLLPGRMQFEVRAMNIEQ